MAIFQNSTCDRVLMGALFPEKAGAHERGVQKCFPKGTPNKKSTMLFTKLAYSKRGARSYWSSGISMECQ